MNIEQKVSTNLSHDLFLNMNIIVSLTCSALNCNFSSSTERLPKLMLVPLVIVLVMPKLLLMLLLPAVLIVPLLLVPPKPICKKPSGFAVGPLQDANKLNK